MSTLAGRRTTDLQLHFGESGGTIATGHLESGAPLEVGAATLVLNDLALPGRVVESALDSPERPMFVFEQGAGWNTLLPAPGAAYKAPGKVRLSTVLRDLAELAGEAYATPGSGLPGAADEALLEQEYGWDASTERPVRARHVLDDLVARGAIPTWRVDPFTGRTRFDTWPALPAADVHGVIGDRDLANSWRDVALSTSVAAWLPGATVQGETIVRLNLVESAKELRAKVWTVPSAHRWIRSVVLALFPWMGRVGLAASKALRIASAVGRTELEGGGPAVGRVGDLVVRLCRDSMGGLHVSTDDAPPYTWTPVASAAIPASPPAPTDAGTRIALVQGSKKVTCG